MQVVEPVSMEPSPSSSSTTPGHDSYLRRKYFSSLDVFRFLAIIGVIWHHTYEGFSWLPASSRGFLGVDFFFEISGFLIVTLLLRERDRAGGISLRQFYIRRALRIFPIYYAIIGVLTAFYLFVKPNSAQARPFFEDLPFQLFYLSNIWTSNSILFITWSLSTEEQFYVVWPAVEKWLRGFGVPILLAVTVLNHAVMFGLVDGLISARVLGLNNFFFVCFAPICFGVLLAHALHDRRWYDRLATWLGPPWMSLALAVLVFVACNHPRSDLSGSPRFLIRASMLLLLASCVIREDNWPNRLLGFPLVRRIGVISYGMYLYHQFVAHLVRYLIGPESQAPFPSSFLLNTALTVAVAELSYRYFETPFLKLKDRLGHAPARGDAPARQEGEAGDRRPPGDFR
jgi:peptidoglycan/LPS O-acetylase OafA/YrhL